MVSGDNVWVDAAAKAIGVVGAVVRITGTGSANEAVVRIGGTGIAGAEAIEVVCRITGVVGVADMGVGAAADLSKGKLPAARLPAPSLKRGSAGAGDDMAGLPQAGADVRGCGRGADVQSSPEDMVWIAGAAAMLRLTQDGNGNRVARTRGKPVKLSVAGVAAALEPLASAPGFRERNSTPILACRRTLCTSGFISLNRDNDNLTTSNL